MKLPPSLGPKVYFKPSIYIELYIYIYIYVSLTKELVFLGVVE